MLLIPELETIVILVPRTGSGSLRRAIAKRYPKSILLYRHMEADGVPGGYDRWRKIGVVRHPVDRLWSLYNFCQRHTRASKYPAYAARMAASVDRSFSDWIVENEVVFTDPYDCNGTLKFFPEYTIRHAIPETRKSQWIYLRPDLGTEIFHFADLPRLERELDVDLSERHNATGSGPEMPGLSVKAEVQVRRFFKWDFDACRAPTMLRAAPVSVGTTNRPTREALDNATSEVAFAWAEMLTEVINKGLIYWEPQTVRGAVAKADMLRRCEEFIRPYRHVLAKLNDDDFRPGLLVAIKMLEATNAGMVPPDGGDPSQTDRVRNVAERIRERLGISSRTATPEPRHD